MTTIKKTTERTVKEAAENVRHSVKTFIIRAKYGLGLSDRSHSSIDEAQEELQHELNNVATVMDGTTIGKLLSTPLNIAHQGIDLAGSTAHELEDFCQDIKDIFHH